MTTQERRCGTCKFLQVPPDSAGRRVPQRGDAYLCEFKPDWPPLPASMTYRYNFGFPALWMWAEQGTECPVWEAHKK